MTYIEFRVTYLCIFSKMRQDENSVQERCNILPKPFGLMLAKPGKYPDNEVWLVCFLGQYCPLLGLWPAAQQLKVQWSPQAEAGLYSEPPWCFPFYSVDPKYFFSLSFQKASPMAKALSRFCGSYPLQHSYSFDIIASEDARVAWEAHGIFAGYCHCSMQWNPLVCSKLSGSFLHSHEQTSLITLFPDCKARWWALLYCRLACF